MKTPENKSLNESRALARAGMVTVGAGLGWLVATVDTSPIVQAVTSCSNASLLDVGPIQNCLGPLKPLARELGVTNMLIHVAGGYRIGEALYDRLNKKIVDNQPLVTEQAKLSLMNYAWGLQRVKLF